MIFAFRKGACSVFCLEQLQRGQNGKRNILQCPQRHLLNTSTLPTEDTNIQNTTWMVLAVLVVPEAGFGRGCVPAGKRRSGAWKPWSCWLLAAACELAWGSLGTCGPWHRIQQRRAVERWRTRSLLAKPLSLLRR